MGKEGLPGRIDNTYLVGMAGGTQSQVKHAFKSLGLVDEAGNSTPDLELLVTDESRRPAALREILSQRYPELTDLPGDATRGHLDETLGSLGLSGATLRKAATFYLHAAKYAELPLSPHLERSAGSASTKRRRASSRRRPSAPIQPPAGGGGDTHRISLRSGGAVELMVSVNLFTLNPTDREFVLRLVDALRQYEEAAEPSSRPIAGRHDQET